MSLEKMSDFFKTPKTKALLWTLCSILGVLVVFGLGIIVGYHRAIFESRFGDNYYRNFGGPTVGMVTRGPLNTHGVTGQVIDVSSSSISVQDVRGDEESVAVVSGTPIREMDNNISVDDIQPGYQIVVIGEPNQEGQIQARFIRVFQN